MNNGQSYWKLCKNIVDPKKTDQHILLSISFLTFQPYSVKKFLGALLNLKHNHRLFDVVLFPHFCHWNKKRFSNDICRIARNFLSIARKKLWNSTKLFSEKRATRINIENKNLATADWFMNTAYYPEMELLYTLASFSDWSYSYFHSQNNVVRQQRKRVFSTEGLCREYLDIEEQVIYNI